MLLCPRYFEPFRGYPFLLFTSTFLVTVEIVPVIDTDGRVDLSDVKIYIGAMNVTFLAKFLATKMYNHRLDTVDVDPQTLAAKAAAALLNNEPFDPVHGIKGKNIRAKKINIATKKLTITFEPAD